MKVLCIGDPHIKSDNITDVNLFIEKLCQLIEAEIPDLIVVLGDVLHYHERVQSIAMNKAYEFIQRLKEYTLVIILVGNHDAYNNQIFLSGNHWMNGMKEWENVIVVDKILHHHTDDLHFVFVPYVPPGRFQEALNTNEEDWKKADCIFAHQEFYGCKLGAIVSVDGDRWPLEYPRIVSGHIHGKQTPQKNIYYCGSAMQHAFGESEQNIIAVLTWPGGKLVEHDLQLPRKRIVYKDVSAMEDYNPEETEDKIKITVSGVYDEFKAFKKTKKYRELIKTGKKVVFKPKKHDLKKDEQKLLDQTVDETDFNKILHNLVVAEKNRYLFQVHELVVRNREISEDDVIFLDTDK
uniref:Calcineurin-like phosphoesterase domain-containing protein n=1 Tax=viral metagenome TaxID=1070528 RepID=A0A6C0EKZ8_9ZZZZ